MATPVYATEAEYDASPYGWAAKPADISDRLAIASRDVDWLLMTAVYTVDENEQATDTDEREAIRQATVAQASFGIDPTADVSTSAGQIPAGYSSVSIGPVSLTKGPGAQQVVVSGITYAPRVVMILHAAGLLPSEPVVL